MSSKSRWYVSDQMELSVWASTNWAVMTTLSPDRLTLPARMCASLSVSAITWIERPWPLNANDDVRAGTRRSGICASALSSSSVIPSEKYSLSVSPLMFSNGMTATDRSIEAVASTVPDPKPTPAPKKTHAVATTPSTANAPTPPRIALRQTNKLAALPEAITSRAGPALRSVEALRNDEDIREILRGGPARAALDSRDYLSLVASEEFERVLDRVLEELRREER